MKSLESYKWDYKNKTIELYTEHKRKGVTISLSTGRHVPVACEDDLAAYNLVYGTYQEGDFITDANGAVTEVTKEELGELVFKMANYGKALWRKKISCLQEIEGASSVAALEAIDLANWP